MYVIVVGAGRVGRELIKMLREDGHEVVFIDQDEKTARDVAKMYDVYGLAGDAASMDLLEKAGIDKADAVIAATGDDRINLVVSQIARSRGVKHVIARVNDPKMERIYRELGVKIVDPTKLCARGLRNLLLHSSADTLATIRDTLELVSVNIDQNSDLAGKKVKEVEVPNKLLVVAIERGDKVIRASEDTELKEGDTIYILARGIDIETFLKKHFRSEE